MKSNFKYSISPFGYLERAEKHLCNNMPESVFYAALELRCAIEARAREQLFSLEDVPKKAIHLWHAEKIMDEMKKRIDGAMCGLILSFKNKWTNQHIKPFTYKPINKSILIEYGKLGNLLHVQRAIINQNFIRKNKRWLKATFKKLNEICKGHMLRPPEWSVRCIKCKRNLTWGDIYRAKNHVLICNCGHKISLKGKAVTIKITARKKSKRSIELLQAERIVSTT
jgi:DNA-directed RNA polymerase subunit RPC12/RpoP